MARFVCRTTDVTSLWIPFIKFLALHSSTANFANLFHFPFMFSLVFKFIKCDAHKVKCSNWNILRGVRKGRDKHQTGPHYCPLTSFPLHAPYSMIPRGHPHIDVCRLRLAYLLKLLLMTLDAGQWTITVALNINETN